MPSLVYCLFPIPMFNKNRCGQEVIHYANEPLQSVFMLGKILFLMHFTITVMFKIIFLQRIASTCDLLLTDTTLQNKPGRRETINILIMALCGDWGMMAKYIISVVNSLMEHIKFITYLLTEILAEIYLIVWLADLWNIFSYTGPEECLHNWSGQTRPWGLCN